MPPEPITIMAVHAHPDDEVVFTGGTLLIYHRRGVRTVVVTATGGEEGEIRDPDLDPDEARPRLRDIRAEELRRGAAVLEIDHLEKLGYRDSGMAGTDANANPDNFHNADLEDATRKVVALVREYRPQIMITYDEFGSYGHPDHIKCNVVTQAAFERAGDASYAPELGEPWQPLKLYYTHWNEEGFERAREMFRERGLRWPWDEEEEQKPEHDPEHQSIEEAIVDHEQEVTEAKAGGDEQKQPEYVPPPTTTRIDVTSVVRDKMESARQHKTQFDPDGLFMTTPEDIVPVMFGREDYSLVKSLVNGPAEETDMLAGLG